MLQDMFLLTLVPDHSCDWYEVADLLKTWNGSIRQQGDFAEDKARFFLQLPDDQEYFMICMELQKMLEPYSVSFFLEEMS